MLSLLKPGDAEIEALALAETDPRREAEFRPLCPGFLPGLLLLAGVGLLGLARALLNAARRLAAGRLA
jgi:hypothetical protein